MAVKFLLAAIFLLLFPAKAFAAFTIENISPAEITSENQELTLFVSAINLSSATQYFQVAITKEGASNYFGQTQGSSGNWTKYASSPDFGSLVSITPSSGNWNGEIKAKLDTADSGFQGSGTYQIKLLKYITSSGSSSNSLPITVNISAPTQVQNPTPLVSPTQVTTPDKPSPQIQFTLVSNLKTGEEFDLPISLLNFEPGSYYAKVRIGKDTSHLTLGQTYNGSWLTDTDSWSKFPITSHGSKLKIRLSSEALAGTYMVRVRLKRTDSDKTFDSEDKAANFSQGEKPPTPTKSQASKSSPTPTKTPTPSKSTTAGIILAAATKVSTVEAEIHESLKTKDLLATHSSLKTTKPKSKSLKLRIQEKLDDSSPLIGGLTIGGFLLFSTGVGWFLKKKYL